MEPGVGYFMKLGEGTEDMNLIYPEPNNNLESSNNGDFESFNRFSESDLIWSVNIQDYEFNGSATVKVSNFDNTGVSEGDQLAVMVNNECRGVSLAEYCPIIDEYVFCNTMGKSGKEPVLVSKKVNVEKYAGGILSVANQISDFCKEGKILSYLGERDDQNEFINQNLSSNINLDFIIKSNSPTILKTRSIL